VRGGLPRSSRGTGLKPVPFVRSNAAIDVLLGSWGAGR
jgi:hypothetical protein